MKQFNIQAMTSKMALTGCILALGLTSCKESFLAPDPLSVFEPSTTLSTEDGIKASLAICDRHLKLYWCCAHNEMTPIGTEYLFSEMLAAAATDKTTMLSDIASSLTPSSDDGDDGPNGDNNENNLYRTNSIWYMWHQGYQAVMFANTVIEQASQITLADEATRLKYLGQGYFHRAYTYYNLVFQFGDVPLMTKTVSSAKTDFRSTKRDAILQMLREDMEKAVEYVPDQAQLGSIGGVNKGACRMLLSKIYLALGEYQKAKEQLDVLINSSGYALMTEPFGTFEEDAVPETWPVKRNVIWDMHRPLNKLVAGNTEVIMGMPNRGVVSESFDQYLTMRILYPFFFNNGVKTTDGKQALFNRSRNDGKYDAHYDYARALGRGIATWRLTWWAQKGEWCVNGKMDQSDLRHSVSAGNWMSMDSLICMNEESVDYGKPIRLYDDQGNLLCNDTIRRWFDVPQYKLYYRDPVEESNRNSAGYQGAHEGAIADLYLFRLAEAYLLRAEAKFYMNPADPTIADDVNIIRQRAHCSELYTPGQVTIGDIMDERARELFFEEWRNVELTRVSLCLARSGQADEWGNTYQLDSFDKQSGTDAQGGSYWYQRLIHHSMYNDGKTVNVVASNSSFRYTVDKHNLYWPIPESEIKANKTGQLFQNYGYDGYDPSIPEWTTWQEAAADE